MVAIPKFEQTKVRGIVTIPTYLHMALVPMTRFAELNSQQVYNNQTRDKRDMMLKQLMM